RGKGGELDYSIPLGAGATTTLWVAVAGSDHGPGLAQRTLTGALKDPQRALSKKIAARLALNHWSRVRLPSDPLLQMAIAWGKQNVADLTQEARGLQIRY